MKDGIFFDGSAASPNPGRACFAFTHIENGEEIHFECGYIGVTSNNVAEYTSLLRALLYCKEKKLYDTRIFGDSMLCVKQVNGRWKIKSDNIKHLADQCKEIAKEMRAQIYWLPRDENKRADELSKLPQTAQPP